MAIIYSVDNNPAPVLVENSQLNVNVDNQSLNVTVADQPVNVNVTNETTHVTLDDQPVSVNVEASALPEGASVSLLQETINNSIAGGFNRVLDLVEDLRATVVKQQEAITRFLDMTKSETLFQVDNMFIETEKLMTPVFMNPSKGPITIHFQLSKESSPLTVYIKTGSNMKELKSFSTIGESEKLVPGTYKCLNLEGTLKFLYIEVYPESLRAPSILNLSVQKKIF